MLINEYLTEIDSKLDKIDKDIANSKEAKSREGISSTCITTSIKRKGFQETHTRISSVAYKVKLPLTLQLQ